MNLNTVIQRMPYWYASRKCMYLTSPPGRGKTTTILRAPEIIGKGTGLNLGVVVINGGLLTPMDALGFGLPKHYEHHSEMVFSDPFFFRTAEGKRLQEYDGGIIFVDEADKMDVDVKKCIGEAALSGRLGPHRIPPGWVIWMAGNTAKHRSGSTKELDHLINRRREIAITDDIVAWDDWAGQNGVMPLTRAFAQQHSNIVFSQDVPEKQGPWCTPRSLVDADRYLQLLADDGDIPIDPTAVEEISGDIGDAAAAQLFSFVKLEREMPKFERIVADPSNVRVPEKPDAQMLVVYSLAHRVDPKTLGAVITYVERIPKEFAITFAKAAVDRLPELVVTPEMNKWALTNSSLMAAIARVAK
jgi:hypothetical protein